MFCSRAKLNKTAWAGFKTAERGSAVFINEIFTVLIA